MTTITQDISSLGSVPTPADPATFDARADTFLGTALPTLRTEINTWAGQANALGADVTTKSETATSASATAVSAKDAAVAAANYVGEWSAQSGAATVPTAVSNSDLVYGLKVDVADITAVEPGVTSGWESTWLLLSAPVPDSPGLILLSTVTAAAAATVLFDSGISSTYDDYIFEVSNLALGVNNAQQLVFQVSVDGGSSWISGASDYFTNQNYLLGGTSGGAQTNTAFGKVTNDTYYLSSTAVSHVSFRICNVNATATGKQFLTNAAIKTNNASTRDISCGAVNVSTAAINAIKFYTNGGTTVTGTFRMYGVRKT